jgi:hypothetical protein
MVKTGGEKEDGGAVNDDSELEEVEDKKVRKRAQKEQKTHWIFIVAPVKILPDGKIVSSRLRVLAPVDETETARYRLNREQFVTSCLHRSLTQLLLFQNKGGERSTT